MSKVAGRRKKEERRKEKTERERERDRKVSTLRNIKVIIKLVSNKTNNAIVKHSDKKYPTKKGNRKIPRTSSINIPE